MFYKTFDEIRDQKFDGMIITGAPVEKMEFEEVEYWDELCEIMDWSKKNVHSTLHICWGAQAGLYHHYGIRKRPLDKKMFGVFPHTVETQDNTLMRGFDDIFYAPHSRHTTIDREEIEDVDALTIIASSEEAGVFAVFTPGGRQIFITGHPEYDAITLNKEYVRDVNLGRPIEIPKNYFPGDDPTQMPPATWRSSANLLYSNWLNYFVYQTTPYDITTINKPE
jgi:homoserine O-succinyltransferase